MSASRQRTRQNSISFSLIAMLVLASLLQTTFPALAQVTRFRISEMALRDPHIYVDFIICNDVTDDPILGFSVNGELQSAIQDDGDMDGLLDFSTVIDFLPLDLNSPTNLMDSGSADCTAPMLDTRCGTIISHALAGDATQSSTTECAAPLVGTTHGYVPAVDSTPAPCFASPTGAVTLDLGGIPLPLQRAQIAGTFSGMPPHALETGLLRGFISEADADLVLLPASLPLIGGQPLSSLLAGGSGGCAAHDDRDMVEGVQGWWFYLNFSAVEVADPDPQLFNDGFED